MAISTFQQASGSTDLSVFYQWLNTNKAGTFLDGMTISLSTTSNENDTISFTDTDSSVTLISRKLEGNSTCVIFVSDIISNETKVPAYASSNSYLVGAILCSKGMILRYYGVTASNTYKYSTGVCLSVDKNDKLSLLVTTSSVPSSTPVNEWLVLTPTSTSDARRICRPYFSASLTALTEIVAEGLSDSLKLPYAFAALSTQIGEEALYSVLIDGIPFITNGIWYIKDADNE